MRILAYIFITPLVYIVIVYVVSLGLGVRHSRTDKEERDIIGDAMFGSSVILLAVTGIVLLFIS